MIGEAFGQLWTSTGLYGFLGLAGSEFGWGNAVMICVGLLLVYLAIKKDSSHCF